MAPGSHTTRRSPYVNPPADIPGEQDELAGAPERSDAGSNKAPTPLETLTLPLVSLPTKDLFTKNHEGVHGDDIGPGTSGALKAPTKN